jgi:hypothetical protein
MENPGLLIPNSHQDQKLYSLRGILIASAVGSCAAGGFLIWRNLKVLDRPEDARNALQFGFISSIVLIALLLAIEIPRHFEPLGRLVFEGLQVGAVYLYLQKVIGPTLEEHKSNGGQFFSTWRSVGVSIPLLIVPLGLFLAGIQIFPDAPGVRPEDQFYWSIAYNNTPDVIERGSVSWKKLQTEATKYPWLTELKKANESDGYQPTITVYNVRIDKFLSLSIVGIPEDHAFNCSWGKIGTEDEFLVLQCGSVGDGLLLFQKFFDRKIPELDSIFAAVGTPYRELLKMQQAQGITK